MIYLVQNKKYNTQQEIEHFLKVKVSILESD